REEGFDQAGDQHVEHGDGRAEQEGAEDHQRILLQQAQGDTEADQQQAGNGQLLGSAAAGQPGHGNRHYTKAQQRQGGQQTEGTGIDSQSVANFQHQRADHHQPATQIGGGQQ